MDQFLKMVVRKRRRKVQLHHLWNVFSFASIPTHALIRMPPIYYLIEQFLKQDLCLCMRIRYLVLPTTWLGIFQYIWFSFRKLYLCSLYWSINSTVLVNSGFHWFYPRHTPWILIYPKFKLIELMMNIAWYSGA